jgi:hypothetical protein
VVWGATMVCVALQVLLALLMLFTWFELLTYGEVARRPTYSWVGLLLPLATGAGSLVAAVATWRARRESKLILSLVASQGVMLGAAAVLMLAFQQSPFPYIASTVLLQPGSRLPPNEIFGSEWALGMITGPLLFVGVLAVPGLVLSVLLGVAGPRTRRQ